MSLEPWQEANLKRLDEIAAEIRQRTERKTHADPMDGASRVALQRYMKRIQESSRETARPHHDHEVSVKPETESQTPKGHDGDGRRPKRGSPAWLRAKERAWMASDRRKRLMKDWL